MPDNPSAPAAGQPASAAPQPASAPQAPQFDPAEYSRLQSENQRLARIEQQYRGVQPFYETARKYGFEKPEHFDRLKPLTERGVKLENLASIFADPDHDNAEQQPLTLESIQKMLDDREGKAKMTAAEAEHKRLLDEEAAWFSDSKIRELIGDKDGKASQDLVDLLRDGAFGQWASSRQQYPEGHPLAGKMGGAGKDWFNGLGPTLTKRLTAAQAHKLAQIGAAATESKPTSTVAGQASAGGAPEKDKGSGDWLASGREKANAALERRKMARA